MASSSSIPQLNAIMDDGPLDKLSQFLSEFWGVVKNIPSTAAAKTDPHRNFAFALFYDNLKFLKGFGFLLLIVMAIVANNIRQQSATGTPDETEQKAEDQRQKDLPMYKGLAGAGCVLGLVLWIFFSKTEAGHKVDDGIKLMMYCIAFFMIFFGMIQVISTPVIDENKSQFAIESALFGMSAVLPFLMLVYLRDNDHMSGWKVFSTCVFLFLVFFALNYILEISGFWGFGFDYAKPDESKDDETKKDESKNDKADLLFLHPHKVQPYSTPEFEQSFMYSSGLYVVVIIVISLVVGIVCMMGARVFNPEYTVGWLKDAHFLPTLLVFLIEAFIFGAISALPIYLMAYNRHAYSGHTAKEFWLVTLKFAIVHMIFQVSGTYKYWFRGEFPDGTKDSPTTKIGVTISSTPSASPSSPKSPSSP